MLITNKCGIENVLVDTTVLDVPDPGPVSKTIFLVKKKYGLPAGAGIHNAVDMWKKRIRPSQDKYDLVSVVANTFSLVMGADFLLYGPVENAPKVYFTCDMADAYIAYSMRQEYRIKPKSTNHPLFRIFRA